MLEQWLGSSWSEVGLVVASTAAVFVAVIAYTRVVGLRSFSKMSSFDFAMTVAVGSIIATTAVTSSATLVNALIGLAVLYVLQIAIGVARVRFGAGAAVDNSPLLLMDGSKVLEDNLRSARLTHDDLAAKLREAGVARPEQVLAVVFETTGDVSVISGEGPLDRELLAGVRT
ncbi:MAG: DUF421 domain-containing protein [Actinomycetota bacterium]|nr:DUF421 domain-containing protein [Actinomycetota bacterium]